MKNWLNNAVTADQEQEAQILSEIIDRLTVAPQETMEELEALGKQGKQIQSRIIQLAKAAQQGDSSPLAQKALKALEQMQSMASLAKKGEKIEYLHQLKCGNKAKKHELGSKTKKRYLNFDKKGAQCPCLLKKVGGRIVQVDCEGNLLING